MSFPFAVVSLVVSCVVVSLVYAMTGSEEPDRWAREATAGFLMMFGGIVALGVVVYVVARMVA